MSRCKRVAKRSRVVAPAAPDTLLWFQQRQTKTTGKAMARVPYFSRWWNSSLKGLPDAMRNAGTTLGPTGDRIGCETTKVGSMNQGRWKNGGSIGHAMGRTRPRQHMAAPHGTNTPPPAHGSPGAQDPHFGRLRMCCFLFFLVFFCAERMRGESIQNLP